MKKAFFIAAAFTMSMSASAANTDTLTVRINGMHCEHCAQKVSKTLENTLALNDVQFNMERHTATIAFDPAKTCADSIRAVLDATGRYKTSPYSRADVIRNKIAFKIADMHCGKCANSIIDAITAIEGVDTISPNMAEQYMTFSYDANRTERNIIRKTIVDAGFTPVNYYESEQASYVYFLLPETQATADTESLALAIDGVDDTCVNPLKKALAVTFDNKETSQEKILEQLKADGIDAALPAPHECKEEAE
ncbi:MAG: cation transporter [Prevotella sp.]|nr:cation transporter [Prevotella sp.]